MSNWWVQTTKLVWQLFVLGALSPNRFLVSSISVQSVCIVCVLWTCSNLELFSKKPGWNWISRFKALLSSWLLHFNIPCAYSMLVLFKVFLLQTISSMSFRFSIFNFIFIYVHFCFHRAGALQSPPLVLALPQTCHILSCQEVYYLFKLGSRAFWFLRNYSGNLIYHCA